MKSNHLQDLMEFEIIPEWVAKRLDKLSSERLKMQAAKQLKPTIEQAVEAMCYRLEHPVPKKIAAPAASPVPIAPPSTPPPTQIVPQKPKTSVLWQAFKFLMNAGLFIGCIWVINMEVHSAYDQTVTWVKEWKMPTPEITAAHNESGHRVALRWTPLGGQYGYRIYYSFDWGDPKCLLAGDDLYPYMSAMINIDAQGHKEAYITVTAVTADKRLESWPSRPLRIDLDPQDNRVNSVEWVAM